jgi:hypothetical protein
VASTTNLTSAGAIRVDLLWKAEENNSDFPFLISEFANAAVSRSAAIEKSEIRNQNC